MKKIEKRKTSKVTAKHHSKHKIDPARLIKTAKLLTPNPEDQTYSL